MRLNDLFWGERAHFWGEIITFWWWMITLGGPSVHCGQILQNILARGRAPSPPLPGNAKILGAYGPPSHPLWTDPSIHLLDDRLDTFISWNIWESMVIGAKLCYRSPKTTGCQASLPDWSRVAALTVVVPPFWRIPWDSWMWPHKCKSGLEEENGRVLIIWWWKLYCILLGPRGPLGVQPSARLSDTLSVCASIFRKINIIG